MVNTCTITSCISPRAVAVSGHVYTRCRPHLRETTLASARRQRAGLVVRIPAIERPCRDQPCSETRAVASSTVYSRCRTHLNAFSSKHKSSFTLDVVRRRKWLRAYRARPAITVILRDQRHARRAAAAGASVTRLKSDYCGVCHLPLDDTAVWPHPMTTTVGHEPPLIRVIRGEFDAVVERPEHWSCNRRKSWRTDIELSMRSVA